MFEQLNQEIENIISFFENEEENVVAQTLKTRIVNRTLNGLDVNMAPLIPYAPPYKKYGRIAKGLSGSPVDLFALGSPHLLNSITQIDHALFFPAEFVQIATGLQARREFFGANNEDWQACADAVVLHYNERK